METINSEIEIKNSVMKAFDNKIVKLNIEENKYNIHKEIIKELAGDNYEWTKELKEIWKSLFLYFIGSPEAEKQGLSLKKSIALAGKYGCGKTTIFRIIHSWLKTIKFRNPNLFRISSTEDILKLFDKKEWTNDVHLYNIDQNMYGVNIARPLHILINEFAYQYDIKNYGTDVKQFIEAFIMKRYDIFQEYGKLTHVTMNFGIKELNKNFHPRIVDRFREMFNVIELPGESFRK